MAAPWTAGAQCRIIGSLHGQNTVNVLNFATNTMVNDDNLDALLLALVEAVKDCVLTTLLPAVTSDWRFVRVEGYRIYPIRSNPIVVTGTPDNVGELSATSVSFSSSLVIIRSLHGGRSGQGRWFLPPAGEAEIAQSVIDGPTLVLLAAFLACVAAKFMGANKTEDWELIVLSRKFAGANFVNFNDGAFTATGLNPKAECATIRSRRLGHGN